MRRALLLTFYLSSASDRDALAFPPRDLSTRIIAARRSSSCRTVYLPNHHLLISFGPVSFSYFSHLVQTQRLGGAGSRSRCRHPVPCTVDEPLGHVCNVWLRLRRQRGPSANGRRQKPHLFIRLVFCFNREAQLHRSPDGFLVVSALKYELKADCAQRNVLSAQRGAQSQAAALSTTQIAHITALSAKHQKYTNWHTKAIVGWNKGVNLQIARVSLPSRRNAHVERRLTSTNKALLLSESVGVKQVRELR